MAGDINSLNLLVLYCLYSKMVKFAILNGYLIKLWLLKIVYLTSNQSLSWKSKILLRQVLSLYRTSSTIFDP